MRNKNIFLIFTITVVLPYYSCSERSNPVEAGDNPPPTPTQLWSASQKPSTKSIESLLNDRAGLIYAGTDGNGILISADNGLSWEFFNEGLPDSAIYCICTDSLGNVYAGTADRGVFKLSSSGQYWEETALQDTTIWALETSPAGDVYAAASDSLYRLSEGQNNWVGLNTSLVDRPVISILFDSEQSIFAGTYARGIIRSLDNGNSWQQNTIYGITILCLGQTQRGDILAGTLSQGGFISTDGGENWENLENGFGSSAYRFVKNSHGLIFCGDYYEGVLVSIDHGNSWIKINENLEDKTVVALALDPDEHLIAGTRGGNLFRTNYPTHPDNFQLLP
jgi:ligand-binding sensor domain-containing protein